MRRIYLNVTLIALMGLLLAAGPTLAQTGGNYEVIWWTIAGGGGISQSDGGDYVLTGVLGQPATEVLSKGEYSVVGGFLTDEAAASRVGAVYLPVIIH